MTAPTPSKDAVKRMQSLVAGSYGPFMQASPEVQAAYAAGVRACAAYLVAHMSELEARANDIGGLHNEMSAALGKMVRGIALSTDILVPDSFEP